jgi:hypothetical protein
MTRATRAASVLARRIETRLSRRHPDGAGTCGPGKSDPGASFGCCREELLPQCILRLTRQRR